MQFTLTAEELAQGANDDHARVMVCGRVTAVSPTQRADLGAFMEELSHSPAYAEAPAVAVDEVIRARRAGIVACAGQDTVGVSVRWEAGTVEVSLQGALAGTPEEACVQRLLADLQAPASPSSGRTVQVVSH